jgi:hypothetical protein
MPGIGATDPADLEAQARAELGFSRRLESRRTQASVGAAAMLCGITSSSCRDSMPARESTSLSPPSIDGQTKIGEGAWQDRRILGR